RLADALERLLPAVLETHTCRSPRQIGYGARYQHLARRRQPADARGDVHRAAVNVVVLADHVAGVEAEVEGETGVVARTPAGEGGFDRLAGGGERREDAVAEQLALDGGAGVLAAEGVQGGVEVAGLPAEGGVP